jgi:hypothetical protein
MRRFLTKLGIIAAFVGTISLSAAVPTIAKSSWSARVEGQIPYNTTCKLSRFYFGFYCYQADPYYVPGYDAYGSYSSCPAAVWNGRQWVRREVC